MNRSDPPLVTILMPTHNRAHFLPDAIHSALAQSYQNLEILVLDNASSDDTGEAVSRYRDEPRLRYVRHDPDLGITGNWRYGITAARGEFFCLLHDDDALAPDFVRALVAPLTADDSLALAFCDHLVMDAQGAPLPHQKNSTRFHRDKMTTGRVGGEAFERAVLVDYSIPVGATLFRRSAVDPGFIDERARGAIDYWLLYQILKTGFSAFYVDRPLMTYRAHPGGMSTNSTLYMAEGHLYRFAAVLEDPRFTAWRPRVAAERRETLASMGIELAQTGRAAEARRALWTALRERPSLRAAAAFLLACGGPACRWLISRLRTPK